MINEQSKTMIAKGAKVRITTTNGGETIAILDQNHRRTYDAVICRGNGWAVIPSFRITMIEAV
jgi:hypothetical protein